MSDKAPKHEQVSRTNAMFREAVRRAAIEAMSDLARRLLAVQGDCSECNSTGVVYELDGKRVRLIPTDRLSDVQRLKCTHCKISEAEWLDLKQRAATAEQIAAAHSLPSPADDVKGTR